MPGLVRAKKQAGKHHHHHTQLSFELELEGSVTYSVQDSRYINVMGRRKVSLDVGTLLKR